MQERSAKNKAASIFQKTSRLLLKFDQKKYLLLALSVFILGFSLAAILTLDKEWWVRSTCSLGMKINGTPELYNYSFIISGVLMLIFATYLKPQVDLLLSKGRLTKAKAIILAILYFVEMITLILVGAIPYGDSDFTNAIHVWLGFYVFINLGIAMFFAFWLFGKFSKRFLIVNYLLFVAALASYFLGIGAHMLPYAIAEMITIVIVLGWMGIALNEVKNTSEI